MAAIRQYLFGEPDFELVLDKGGRRAGGRAASGRAHLVRAR